MPNIKKVPPGSNHCEPDADFNARRGDTVTFTFPEAKDAVLTFGTLFNEPPPFVVGDGISLTVRLDAPLGPLTYDIDWKSNNGGHGNGEGEIIR
jgi:hypothetical protein